MFYSVQIAQIGSDGVPLGSPSVQTAPSESEAIQIMRQAIKLARDRTYPMRFSVIGPGRQLLLTYTSGELDEPAVSAVSA